MSKPDLRQAAIRISYHVAMQPQLREAIEAETAGQPGAQSFEQDRTSGHATPLHCWEHGQPPSTCHREGRWVGDSVLAPDERDAVEVAKRTPCQGEPIPGATDITGEAGTIDGEQGRADMKEVTRLERQMADTADRLAVIHRRYLPGLTLPGDVKAKLVSASLPGCESCDRLDLGEDDGWFNEANYNGGRPTNFGGALTKRMILCRSCAEWALDHDHESLCLDAEGNPRKGHPHYPHAIHLPPVRGQLPQTLAKKREYGRWSGKKEPKAA